MNKCKSKVGLCIFKTIVPVLSIAYFLFSSYLVSRIAECAPRNMDLIELLVFRFIAAVIAVFLFYIELSKVFPYIKKSRFKKPSLPQLLVVAGMSIILFFVSNLLICVVFKPEMRLLQYSSIGSKFFCFSFISSTLIAPLFEEMCFRVIPVSVYRSRIPRVMIMIICGIVFGYIHNVSDNQLLATVAGMFLGIIFLIWRNPLLCIFAHSLLNLLSSSNTILSYFSVDVYVSTSFPAVSKYPTKVIVLMLLIGMLFLVIGGYLKVRNEE